ncbi:type II CAAX endopeptidase family protein [Ramlibacter solisilvae]|uniref:CPBP family intramembrane glutamic endopeptidase n=1 Tax=Ramlibacter tataouinensis TaxID=94132 RepID=UPI0007776825|nr:CPBP family intramembrane glutamic endopeptidase [Ramlibacter tataouinensis]
MSGAPLAFEPPPDAPRWKRRLLYSALARIVIFTALAFGTTAGAAWLLMHGVPGPGLRQLPPEWRGLVRVAVMVACTVGAYLFLARVIERRPPVELWPSRGLAHLTAGALAGLGLIALTVALLWLAGAYRIVGTRPGVDWWTPLLTVGLGTAIAEEIAFRGVLFRAVEEAAGTWWALGVSALFFGAVHGGNPGATFWSLAAIAIEAGLMLALVFHLTRSLPLCIGIHTGWNYSQGTVFGIPVSGTDAKGWLISERPGPDWLTGGVFGAEASVLAVAVSALLSAALLAHAWRHRTFVPMRRHRPMMEAAPSAGIPC